MPSKFSIRKWPFDDKEIVNLFWICSPYQVDKKWMLTAVFKDQHDKTTEIEVPWGTLPFLRLGEYYSNKVPMGEYIGDEVEIELDDLSKGKVEEKRKFPRIYMLRHSHYYQENCWTIKEGEKKIIIPCIEVTRSFFASYQIIANQLLKPYGMFFLVDEHKIKGKKLYIKFNSEFPLNLLREEGTLKYISWLLCDDLAKSGWSDVCRSVFKPLSSKLNKMLLKTKPPLTGPNTFKVRAIQNDNNEIFVLEIISIGGLSIPFEKIQYEHERDIKRRTITQPKQKTTKKRPITTIYQLDNKSSPKKGDSRTVESFPSRYNFADKIEVVPMNRKTETSVVKKQDEKKKDSKNTMRYEPGVTSDYDFEVKKLPALERKDIAPVDPSVPEGLKDFVLVVDQIIPRKINGVKSNYEIKALPQTGKLFCKLANGSVRKCAIAQISTDSNKRFSVIEVDRTHLTSLSTLILIPVNEINKTDTDKSDTDKSDTDKSDTDKLINELLERFVDNNGWDYVHLDQNKFARYNRLWHSQDNSLDKWAIRILDAGGVIISY